MDPFSVAGLTLGATGLTFQVFSGCIKAYQLFIDVKDVPQQYRGLHTRLKIEQSRLLLWGESIGLVQEILETPSQVIQMQRNLIVDVLLEVQDLFRSCITIEKKYDQLLPVDPQPLLPSPQRSSSGNRAAFLRRTLAVWDSTTKSIARLEWAMIKKAKFADLIERLVLFNARIEGFLDRHTLNDLHAMQTQSNLTLLHVNQQVGELRLLVEALNLAPVDHTQQRLSRSSTLVADTAVQDDTLSSLATFMEKGHEIQAISAPHGDMKVQIGDVHFADNDRGQSRRFGAYEGKDVWIEMWEPHDDSSPKVQAQIELRIFGLACLLASPSKPPSFRAPRCMGYLREDIGDTTRYGLLYDKTPHDKVSHSRLISLRDVLGKTRAPSLTQRIALATRLAHSMLYLHAVNWLHKGMKSDSILFFSPVTETSGFPPAPVPNLSEAVVSGFDFARPSLSSELTLGAPASFEHKMYRHPDLLKEPPLRSSKIHDIYSLGLVLLEVFLWQPVEQLVGLELRARNLPFFRHQLLSPSTRIAEKLSARAGESISKAVMCCITGGASIGLEAGDHTADAADSIEVQQAFFNNVVRPFEAIRV